MDAPTTAILISLVFTANLNINLDINVLIDQLKKSKPIVPKDLSINVSDVVKVTDDISVTVSRLQPRGSLSMVKTTNNPTAKELELIKAARGDRPYNLIFDVRVGYDENGNVTSIQWNEN